MQPTEHQQRTQQQAEKPNRVATPQRVGQPVRLPRYDLLDDDDQRIVRGID